MPGDITDELAQDAEFQDNMLLVGLDTFTYENKTYAISVLSSGVSLWYNKEIFAYIGLTPPETYDEL
ncbi:hypothetical protein D3C77_617890 [compost metagenome]